MRQFLKAYWLSMIITTLGSIILFIATIELLMGPSYNTMGYLLGILRLEGMLLLINLVIFVCFSLPAAFLLRKKFNPIIALIFAHIISEMNLFGLAVFIDVDTAIMQIFAIPMGLIFGILFTILYLHYLKCHDKRQLL